jgi:hypothetical protein
MSRAAFWTGTSLTSRKALERGEAEIQRMTNTFKTPSSNPHGTSELFIPKDRYDPFAIAATMEGLEP